MRVLVIGKTGQVAQALARQMPSGIKADFLDRQALDLSWGAEKLDAVFRKILNADAVINAAAYTNVNGAEGNADLAFAVNASAVDVIAKVCAEKDTALIHISTDYVFDGENPRPYVPTDTPNPLNVYGASKLAGEMAMQASGVRGAIVRTSWVFDGVSKNFFTSIMNKALINPNFDIVRDQIGRPTHAGVLADALLAISSADLGNLNIYHVCGNGPPVGWDDFARAFLSRGFADTYQPDWVNSIDTIPAPGTAQRPPQTVMQVSAFEDMFSYTLPDWREGIDLAIRQWKAMRHKGE